MKKRLLSLVTTAVVAATMLFGGSAAAFAGETPAGSKAAGATVKVEASMQAKYDFIMCHQVLTVSPDISQEYGFDQDGVDAGTTDKVTALDVMLAMHKAHYGDQFTKDTAKDYFYAEKSEYGGYYATKAFGTTCYMGFYIDDGYAMSTDVAVADGSKIDWYAFQEEDCSDKYAYFSKAGKSSRTYSGEENKAIPVEIYGTTGQYADNKPVMGAIPNAKIYVADQKTGDRKGDAIAKTDAKGQANVTFTKAGTYYLTAIRDQADGGYITMPWCKVTVAAKPATEKPKKVTGVSVKGKKKAITVSWKRDSKASGYEIFCATNAKFKKGKKIVTVKKNKTTKKTVKKLKAHKKYYVKVRAYKKVDGKNIYGAYSKVKKAKTK